MNKQIHAYIAAAVLIVAFPAAAADLQSDIRDLPGAAGLASSNVSSFRDVSRLIAAAGKVEHVTSMATPDRNRRNYLDLSEEGAQTRWLYSALADRRTFVSYASAQRGRPAELRFGLRLRVL